MKKKNLIMSTILLVILLAGSFAQGCGFDNQKNTPQITNPQQINIVKSELKLTQEDTLSQIRDDLIKKCEEYPANDEVIVLATLSDDALIDTFNRGNVSGYDSVSDYALSKNGLDAAKRLTAKQESLVNNLKSNKLITEVEYYYSTIVNAVAVRTTYGNVAKISKLAQVDSVILSEKYNRPMGIGGDDASAIENLVDVYETGIFNSSSVSYTGEGTAVAVLDSGFDCSHSVFNISPQKQVVTQQSISQALSQTNAAAFTKNLTLSDVHYSRKIPFVYDYADKDSDVFPYDSEHGTHVAGIIGGKDDVITGVAINTQLVLMKVFSDLNDGANTTDILAALEDAVLLNVDAINMSLGSSCGFAREEDGNAINAVYDKINQSGISLLTAASNSYSSGYGGAQGNTNMVTNPDSGTVGSPSTYAAALSVASISGTKSRYLFANDKQIIFYNESNSITGDPNDFFVELGMSEGDERIYEYVTVPGVGLPVNFAVLGDLTGKIALIKRGNNTFEEKAVLAKNAGAVACIIYNNIDGDILMSMGKTDHIPTISISKDDGVALAALEKGSIAISYKYKAGPFMSDFSSWGPTPSLNLKPDITAHGGNIKSSIPGGGYDQISGTSMATPNLCGIVVLIRQYLKDSFPDYTTKQISVLANQLLMSTATIVLNQEGNPYSPRKQGAGLASLYNAVNTKAYLSVEGGDRSKLELFDDPQRKGVYEMEFSVVNLSSSTLTYNLSLVGMTESVSTYEPTHVAEKAQLLSGEFEFEVDGSDVSELIAVEPYSSCKIKVVYRLSQDDKNLIDSLFPYGMYVEGFVKLKAGAEEIDMNIPFLAFYGDWTEAPLFDKTFYEVESQAHDRAIDDEDKLKADYYATTPYGSYYYNYIIPLGTYLYDIDETVYDAIPASQEHIAISDYLGTIDGISAVYAGLLRNAKTMTFSIVDKVTGDTVYRFVDYNANKSYSYGGSPIPYFEYLKLNSSSLGLVNNRQYEFKMEGMLDYADGGVGKNVRNSFSFDFYLDNEAPILKNTVYEKVYDKNLKKDRYYLTMTIYDNHYVQSITPVIFTSNSQYAFLTKDPIPVYSEKGKDNVVRFEITDYLEDIESDKIITNALAFSIDDYALNSNIYICQLPGTDGDFTFTKDGTMEGSALSILTVYENDIVDLSAYLASGDKTLDDGKGYLKYLQWDSSNDKVATVKEGLLNCVGVGRASISAKEMLNGKQAILIVNVKQRPENDSDKKETATVDTHEDAKIKSLRFSYFDTLFAYSRAAQTSEIGSTGDRLFLNSMSQISVYPGEKIQLAYDFDPWYAEDKYNLTYASTNSAVAMIGEDGVVTALKKGSVTITLSVGGSNVMARVKINVKSEFVIEDRTLIAYKGLGGNVVIPNDEGIRYIGSYAFCLYVTDNSIELSEDDYDANKIPATNTTITSVVVPHGVEEIQKYAFYNCKGLRSVEMPDTVKYIREFAFYNDVELTSINIRNVQTIARAAFSGCIKLKDISLGGVFAIGRNAFENCKELLTADLTALRNTGNAAFTNCTNLKSVILSPNTKLSYAMFANSGLTSVDIYQSDDIPAFAFAKCANLKTVTLHNDLVGIGEGAFSDCPGLTDFNINGTLGYFGNQVFYNSTALTEFTLPDCEFTFGSYVFYKCEKLDTLNFNKDTFISRIQGSVFQDTALESFVIDAGNTHYSATEGLLLSKDGKTIILAAVGKDFGNLVLNGAYEKIADGAFSGVNITSLTIDGELVIGDYAFANCSKLKSIVFPLNQTVTIGNYAFYSTTGLESVSNLDKIMDVGEYAFALTSVKELTLGDNAQYGEGAFFQSSLTKVIIGEKSEFGLGCFQNCKFLVEVVMPQNGGVHFGAACFANAKMLKTIDLSKLDNEIERETFYGCSSLIVANLLTVEYIGNYAFADCSMLGNINIPKVISIGEGAFSRNDVSGGAPVITEIILPNTLKTIGDGAFLGCEGLLQITIPDSVTEMGDYTFAYCLRLAEVNLPSTITRIGKYSFAGCAALISINTENIEEIADYGFASAESLTTVDLAKVKTIGIASFASAGLSGDLNAPELLSIGDYSFQYTFLKSFNAPKLREIGVAALQYNTKLTEFVFSKDIKDVKMMSFNGCTALTSFYFYDADTKVSTGIINEYAMLDSGCLYTKMESNHYQLSSVPAARTGSKLEVADGTYRIEFYAGNENKNITYIVLPDSLKLIGNYAFYGYKNLTTVEFRSFTAPVLENAYNSRAVLAEEDPGFKLLHNQFDIFGFELCYYNFIDLVGKRLPINMVLPSNENIEGYTSIIFEAYFGRADDSVRSEYVAMDKNLVDFYNYATEIFKINVITMSHETLVNKALSAYNATKQDPTEFGYSAEEWAMLVKIVNDAKAEISAIKLANASQNVKEIQKRIDALSPVFDISSISGLKQLASDIDALLAKDKALLNMTNYNALLAEYQKYRDTILSEAEYFKAGH